MPEDGREVGSREVGRSFDLGVDRRSDDGVGVGLDREEGDDLVEGPFRGELLLPMLVETSPRQPLATDQHGQPCPCD